MKLGRTNQLTKPYTIASGCIMSTPGARLTRAERKTTVTYVEIIKRVKIVQLGVAFLEIYGMIIQITFMEETQWME